MLDSLDPGCVHAPDGVSPSWSRANRHCSSVPLLDRVGVHAANPRALKVSYPMELARHAHRRRVSFRAPWVLSEGSTCHLSEK